MLRVVIVGAGLGGLACAIACRGQGLDVIVLERASEILPVGSSHSLLSTVLILIRQKAGAGVAVPPNGVRAMKHLDLHDKLRSRSIVVETMDVRRYDDGALLTRRRVGSQKEIERYGGEWWCVVTYQCLSECF